MLCFNDFPFVSCFMQFLERWPKNVLNKYIKSKIKSYFAFNPCSTCTDIWNNFMWVIYVNLEATCHLLMAPGIAIQE